VSNVFWHGAERVSVNVDQALENLSAAEGTASADFAVEIDGRGILSVLVQDGRGFVMWMREPGDAGQVASEPSGSVASWSFKLSNGQRDTYDDRQTVTRERAFEIARQFIVAPERLADTRWE
jgi:hypothetical protein